jgi:enoyl-CoA hydratase/carnithine racemase
MIEREDRGAVTRLTLADPDRLNALSDEMLVALSDALEEVAGTEARVVVLAARGRAFCAGHDLRQMQAMRQAEDGGAAAFADLFERCAAVMMALRRLPQPVIAEVQGAAVAAGCQLVASCDMAVASEAARFGVNGVSIGLFCSTPMVALTRAVPRKAAFEMLTTGRIVGAREALSLGLVNRVAAPEALEAEAMDLAGTVADKLAAAMRIGKRTFHEQAEMGIEEAYAHAGAAMAANMGLDDTAEGIAAFLEKRPPAWS